MEMTEKQLTGSKRKKCFLSFFVESPASTRVTRNSGKQPTIMSMFSKVCVWEFYLVPFYTFSHFIHLQQIVFPCVIVLYKFLRITLSCSQKRKSEDLNGEATNGQTEVKKEEDAPEEVKHFYVSDV